MDHHNLVQRDTILVLMSGGGSALLTVPAEGLSLEDVKATTRAVAEAGASIKVCVRERDVDGGRQETRACKERVRKSKKRERQK